MTTIGLGGAGSFLSRQAFRYLQMTITIMATNIRTAIPDTEKTMMKTFC